MSKGWKEVCGAIFICVAISLVIALVMSLAGCAGTSAAVMVSHESSAPDYYDRCEENTIGPDLRFPITGGRQCGAYCPEMSLYLGWDVRRGAVCEGREPVGRASFRFPVWVKK